jgi:hypothetical protein
MHEVENAQVVEVHGGGNIDLWHQWLGHLGVEDLKLLVRKKICGKAYSQIPRELEFLWRLCVW